MMCQSAARLARPFDARELLSRFASLADMKSMEALELKLLQAYKRGVHEAYFGRAIAFLRRSLPSQAAIADFLALGGPSNISHMLAGQSMKGEHFTWMLHKHKDLPAPHPDTRKLFGIARAASCLKAIATNDPVYMNDDQLRPNGLALLLTTICTEAWHREKDNPNFRVLTEVALEIVASAPMLDVGENMPKVRPEQYVRLIQELYLTYADYVIATVTVLADEVSVP